jgi:hypothetical protein
MLDDADRFFARFAGALEERAGKGAAIGDLLCWVEEEAGRAGERVVEAAAIRGLLLYIVLTLALGLPLTLVLVLIHRLVRAHTHAHDLYRALIRDRDLDLLPARTPNRDLDLMLARNLPFDRASAIYRKIALVHDLAGAHVLDRVRAGDRDLSRILNLYFDLDRDLPFDPIIHRARAVDRDLTRALAVHRVLDLDLDRALALVRDLDLDQTYVELVADYVYVCHLYVECLDVASVSDREGLRDRLLRAPRTTTN